LPLRFNTRTPPGQETAGLVSNGAASMIDAIERGSRLTLEPPPKLVRPCILECSPYVAGRPREEVQRMLGIQDVLKLASNENPLGPSPMAMDAVRREIPGMHYYPDDSCRDLRGKLAQHWSLPPDRIVVGNGSMQILELLCKTFLNDGEEVITGVPAFRVFGGLIRAAGGVHVAVPLRQHVHDLEAMRAAFTSRTKMMIVCNPNNPTGTVVSPHDLREVARSIPRGVVLVVDEAYAEYTSDGALPDFREIMAICPTAVILRSFSKAYGLAGLRVGYAVASRELADYLERGRMPFVANRLGLAAASAALDDTEFVASSRANNAQGMRSMRAGLSRLGLFCVPSEANFMAVRVAISGRTAAPPLTASTR